MAKNKQQKRKAKLAKRKQSTKTYNDLGVYIDRVKIRAKFPDKQKRLAYIKSLISMFDEKIGTTA